MLLFLCVVAAFVCGVLAQKYHDPRPALFEQIVYMRFGIKDIRRQAGSVEFDEKAQALNILDRAEFEIESLYRIDIGPKSSWKPIEDYVQFALNRLAIDISRARRMVEAHLPTEKNN